MKNIGTGLCMDAADLKNSDGVLLAPCNAEHVTQKWDFIKRTN
jgi:hypothetical protein